MTSRNVEETVAWVLKQLGEAPEVPEEVLSLAMRYRLRAYKPLDQERLAAVLKRVGTRKERKMLSKVARELLAEGVARGVKRGERRGEARGERRGKAQGEAKALLLVLERRFGALPDDLLQRVRKAGSTQLEVWLRRSVNAATLDAVFRKPLES